MDLSNSGGYGESANIPKRQRVPLRSFYKHALKKKKKNITWEHLETKQLYSHIL